MNTILSDWDVKNNIRTQVLEYMAEYVKNQDVQDRIKKTTHEKTDLLLDNVVQSIVLASERAIKSEYSKFGE